MKKVAFYARVSSDIQKKEGTIESQIAELKRQIIKAGDKLVKEYTDDGYSGADLDRPALNQLRKDLKTKVFETIYILNTDRIARDVTYQNIIIGEMLHHKKQIIINGVDYIHNPENKFNLTVLGAVAELERAKLIERTDRGKQHRLKQGYLLGLGALTYGYDYHRKTSTSFPFYTVNEKQAEIIRFIYTKYDEGGIGIKEIVRTLEKMDAPKKVGTDHWTSSHVKYILHNEMYTGTRYFNTMKILKVVREPGQKGPKTVKEFTDRSTWIGIKVPVIIPKEQFDKMQARLAFNSESFRNAVGTQLFSNLVFCGSCDSRCFVYRRSYAVERKNGFHFYQRRAYHCRNTNPCHNVEIDNRLIESCVFDMVPETLFDPEKLKKCMDVFNKKKEVNQAKIKEELGEIDEKIKKITVQKKRIVDLYALGDLDRESYVQRIYAYDSEIAILKVGRSELMKRTPFLYKTEAIEESIKKFCKEAKKQYALATDFNTKRRFFLDRVVKISYLRKDKDIDIVTLHGVVPIHLKAEEEPVGTLQFSFERSFNRTELFKKLRAFDQKDDTQGGTRIQRKEYGELVTKQSSNI